PSSLCSFSLHDALPISNSVLDSLRGMRMRFDSQSKMARLIHRGSEFLRRKFLRIGIAAVRKHRAAGKNFDELAAAVDEASHFGLDRKSTRLNSSHVAIS